MKVPFGDLHTQYLSLKKEIDDAINGLIKTSSFIRGAEVTEFESSFADIIEANYCVSCGNGTDALYIAMRCLGIEQGDEVIVPAMSWISTSETVTQAGGKVVFCDINNSNYTINTDLIEERITARTKGIVCVHLYGHPANMTALSSIAEKHGLWIIEDCAQAHLAKFKDSYVGSFGDYGTFSFYPGKNLGAMGDAGALVTDSTNKANLATRFARHGGLVKGEHQIEGINSRLDSIQAAVLNIKLTRLKEWTKKRIEFAKEYKEQLDLSNLKLPKVDNDVEHVWHLYVVQSEDRNEIIKILNENEISTSINYPVALPSLPCYKYLNHSNDDFPIASELASNGFCLPIYAEMSEAQHKHVVDVLNAQ